MHIEPLFRPIQDVLNLGFFFVPRFQRPYSWEDQQIEEFWQDSVVDESEVEYFIGSLVLYKESGKFGIVDGQQRLTTITMILCALRDAFAKWDERGLADGLNQLIFRTNIDNKLQAVLASEATIPYFQSAIQQLPDVHAEVPTSVEEKRLASAFRYITEKVAQDLSEIDADDSLTVTKKKDRIKEHLRKVRDRILGLKAVALTLDNDVDAYMIFETLNTRGKDLELGDLVRTHLTKCMPQKNSTTDQVRVRFDQLRKAFDQNSRNLDDFILHFWLSKYEYTAKRKIYKRLRKKVMKSNAKQFLTEFLSDGNLYLDIISTTRRAWKNEELGLAESLNALQIFRVEQPIPFVLSVMRAYVGGIIALKTTKRAIRAVENFHFAFTALTSSRSSGGISQMYSRHALAIAELNDTGKISQEIDELIAKLRLRRPSREEFVAEFRALTASEKLSRDKKIVQYVLHRMASTFDGKVLERAKMTIEHLASQGSRTTSLDDETIASIGNLTWISDSTQKQLGTKKAEAKSTILSKQGYWVDDVLAKHSGPWGKKEIHNRADELARLAWENVWSI